MLMEALRKICYSLLPPSSLPSLPLSLTSSSFFSIVHFTAEAPPSPPGLSSVTASQTATSASPPNYAATTLYKIIAFLALLSLLPSSPPFTTTASMVKEADLQKMFKLRNENDWKSLWHSEKHVRCRDQLLTHMDWACQKDIYRLEKRFKSAAPSTGKVMNPLREIFIGKDVANMVIKPWSGYARRKREEKSITDECCSAAGCSWEEYAEYCPAHRRLQTRRFATNKKNVNL